MSELVTFMFSVFDLIYSMIISNWILSSVLLIGIFSVIIHLVLIARAR